MRGGGAPKVEIVDHKHCVNFLQEAGRQPATEDRTGHRRAEVELRSRREKQEQRKADRKKRENFGGTSERRRRYFLFFPPLSDSRLCTRVLSACCSDPTWVQTQLLLTYGTNTIMQGVPVKIASAPHPTLQGVVVSGWVGGRVLEYPVSLSLCL